MGLYPITINTAPEAQPHIFAQDDAAIYQAICGDDCVFNIGNKFKTTTLSNNKIRLSDGVLQVGGHIARIKSGDYEDLTIANGVSGKKRVDIIVCRFQTTGKIDNMQLIVKQGTAGTTYVDPALVQNDLYSNGTTREMPLYRVKIDGLNVVAVEQMFTLRETMFNMIEHLKELQNVLEIAQPISKNSVIVDCKGSSEALINVNLPNGKLIPICVNGDPKAFGAFIIGCHMMPGNKQIKVKFNTNVPGNFRINYVVLKI